MCEEHGFYIPANIFPYPLIYPYMENLVSSWKTEGYLWNCMLHDCLLISVFHYMTDQN